MKVPCEHLLILFLLSHAFVCCVMGQEEYNHKKSTVAPRDKVQREIHVTRDQQTSQNNGGNHAHTRGSVRDPVDGGSYVRRKTFCGKR